jgi:hypothetical protein
VDELATTVDDLSATVDDLDGSGFQSQIDDVTAQLTALSNTFSDVCSTLDQAPALQNEFLSCP